MKTEPGHASPVYAPMSEQERLARVHMREKAGGKTDAFYETPGFIAALPTATDSGVMREFSTGANRDTAIGKHDFDGFVSPLVLEAFGTYMDFNRHLPTGALRDSDNWQKGIPQPVYVKSGWRHFIDWWREHRGYASHEGIVWAICGLLFNAQGYLHEYLKAHPDALADALAAAEARRAFDPRFAKK